MAFNADCYDMRKVLVQVVGST